MKDEKVSVFIESTESIRRDSFQHRLWLATRNMNISRRKWPDAIADAIYNYKGDIFISKDSRMLWPIPVIVEVWGDPRWLSYFLEMGKNGERRRGVIMLERLRLIDLYFKIKHPAIAKHFSR